MEAIRPFKRSFLGKQLMEEHDHPKEANEAQARSDRASPASLGGDIPRSSVIEGYMPLPSPSRALSPLASIENDANAESDPSGCSPLSKTSSMVVLVPNDGSSVGSDKENNAVTPSESTESTIGPNLFTNNTFNIIESQTTANVSLKQALDDIRLIREILPSPDDPVIVLKQVLLASGAFDLHPLKLTPEEAIIRPPDNYKVPIVSAPWGNDSLFHHDFLTPGPPHGQNLVPVHGDVSNEFNGANKKPCTSAYDSGGARLPPGFGQATTVPIESSNELFEKIYSLSQTKRLADSELALFCLKQLIDLVPQMGASDRRPNGTLYQAVIHAFAQLGKPDRAEEILTLMWEDFGKGSHFAAPNIRIYTSVMLAWFKTTDPERKKMAPSRCEEHLAEVEKLCETYKSCTPDLKTYTVALQTWAASCQRGSAVKCTNILHRMQCRHLKPDTVSYIRTYRHERSRTVSCHSPNLLVRHSPCL